MIYSRQDSRAGAPHKGGVQHRVTIVGCGNMGPVYADANRLESKYAGVVLGTDVPLLGSNTTTQMNRRGGLEHDVSDEGGDLRLWRKRERPCA